MAPASAVNAALGTRVGDPQAQQPLDGAVVCRYEPVAGAQGTVIVRIQTDMSRASFDHGRSSSAATNKTTADVAGFQDAAYTSVLSESAGTTNTIVALSGSDVVGVTSPASFDAEKSLERYIFARLM
jgi:hypothetical protein